MRAGEEGEKNKQTGGEKSGEGKSVLFLFHLCNEGHTLRASIGAFQLPQYSIIFLLLRSLRPRTNTPNARTSVIDPLRGEGRR